MKFLLAIFSLLVLCVGGDEIKPHVTCDRDYIKVGCFKELHNPTENSLLITDKDDENDAYQGFDLDFDKMNESMHSIACRCSEKSKEEGYNFFYIIHWAECWSSKGLNVIQDVGKAFQRSSQCFSADFLECDDEHIEECAGGSEGISNPVYLYKVVKAVNSSEPAIDGGLSEWSEFSKCSATCGDGIKERERTCTNPVPRGTGKDCSGDLSEVVKCSLAVCKTDPESKNLTIEPTEPLIVKEENMLKKGNLVATLKSMKKEYFVSFELKPTSYEKGWKSVVHLTIGNNFLHYGDRNPGVWFHKDGSGRLLLCSAINGNRNRCIITRPLQLNQWSRILISQQLFKKMYIFKIFLNGKNIFSAINRAARDFPNVKVFVADPWHNPQKGFVRNLKVVNGKLPKASSPKKKL